MDSLTKALALARLGIKVFPCDRKSRAPLTPHGFYDATIDFELIATWFSLDFPQAEVGVWAGGSDLIVADIDRKNGKDGFVSMGKAEVTLSETEHYLTATGGGEHHIWASDDPKLTLVGGVFGPDSGIDIRAGGSYFVWWGDTVPESREAFSTNVPPWILKAATPSDSEFTGEGFSGSVQDWLKAIPDEDIPSSSIRYFMERIPDTDFGHAKMVELAWELVRLGSERETGVKMALTKLHDAWLRPPYNTPAYRKDFDIALRGGISKAGRVQNPTPTIPPITLAMTAANEAGVGAELRALERKVSGNSTEIDLARIRKEMFKVAATGGLSPANALGIVANSKSVGQSKVSISTAWFSDGEPSYHDAQVAEDDDEGFDPELQADPEADLKKLVMSLSSQAESFSFLTEDEQTRARAFQWWGKEYLEWVQTRLKHYNKPYHVGSMWAAVSTMISPWGKLPIQGYKLTDCNLYLNVLGDSSSGKSEAWGFGRAMVNAYYANASSSPIIGDVKRSSALSLHRALILRDKEPSLVYSDEVQGFFQDIQTSHWQGTMLGDLSDYHGGDVAPKNTMNDKELAGKSAQSLLTVYLTGIADLSLDAISIENWRSGLFYRFLWAFGEPRRSDDHKTVMMSTLVAPDAKLKEWARELNKRHEQQDLRWGQGRRVDWDADALERFDQFTKTMEDAVRASPLFDTVMLPANGRFKTSIMKCATLVALSEMSETVTLDHVLVAIDFAGPWHKSMVLAIEETGKTAFDRETEKLLTWMKRNSIKQLGKRPTVQRASIMRQFKPNEQADRLLRQLVEEGWIVKAADTYELTEG